MDNQILVAELTITLDNNNNIMLKLNGYYLQFLQAVFLLFIFTVVSCNITVVSRASAHSRVSAHAPNFKGSM